MLNVQFRNFGAHISIYRYLCNHLQIKVYDTLTQKFSLCPFMVSIQPLVVMAV